MQTIKLEIIVPKESSDIGLAIAKLLEEIAKALEDGKITPLEVFAIIKDSWTVLIEACKGLKNVPEDVEMDVIGSMEGIMLPILSGLKSLLPSYNV